MIVIQGQNNVTYFTMDIATYKLNCQFSKITKHEEEGMHDVQICNMCKIELKWEQKLYFP